MLLYLFHLDFKLLQRVTTLEKNQEILLQEMKSCREFRTNSQSVQAPHGV